MDYLQYVRYVPRKRCFTTVQGMLLTAVLLERSRQGVLAIVIIARSGRDGPNKRRVSYNCAGLCEGSDHGNL